MVIYLAISSGINARDFLQCGLLEALHGHEIVLITNLVDDPTFRAEFAGKNLRMLPTNSEGYGKIEIGMGILLGWINRHAPYLAKVWRLVARGLGYYSLFQQAFEAFPPDVVVIPTPRKENPGDVWLALAAEARDVPTVCVVSSWDNLSKGRFHFMARRTAVWSEYGRSTAVTDQGFRFDQVEVVGALQFDPYFRGPEIGSREALCAKLGLDATRKIILVATVGPFFADQTFIVEQLLNAQTTGELDTTIQIVCRVHFADRTEFFSPYTKFPNFRLDDVGHWYKTLGMRGWTMGLDDIHHMASLLVHADVVVNMGSTVTIEAAIFDTPTVVVAYSPVEATKVTNILDHFAFQKHFRPLVEQSLLTIVRSREEMLTGVRHYLAHPKLMQQERHEIVRSIAQFTDGRTHERVADFILGAVNR